MAIDPNAVAADPEGYKKYQTDMAARETSNPGSTTLSAQGPVTGAPGGASAPPPPGSHPTAPALGGTSVGGGVTGTAINPLDSLRQQVLQPGQVNTQITPGETAPSAIDVSGFGIDTGAISGGSAANASAGQRLGFQINPQSVLDNAMQSFRSQLPGLNQDFADQSEQLAKGTSAMGRTGSGLFNRDTGFISDRARATREGLLGNLSFQGATSDQSADLQAQMTQQGLLGSQENRFANTNIANAAGQNQMSMANSNNMLQAMMANQNMNAGAAQFNAQGQMQTDQFNAGNNMAARGMNIQNAIGQNQFGANFMAGQQANQNAMAGQAQSDYWNQLNGMAQGFQNDPAYAQGTAAGGYGDIANTYGGNASEIGAGLQKAAAGGVSLVDQVMAGQQPGSYTGAPAPGPLPTINQQPTMAPQIDPRLVRNQPRPDMVAGMRA
jgi:hypothetical protein